MVEQIKIPSLDELQRRPASTMGFVPCRLAANPTRRIRPEIDRDHNLVKQSLRAAIRKCCAGETRWPLFLHGPAGTGKTCAALALCDFVFNSAYWTTRDLVREYADCVMGRMATSLGYEIFPGDFWRSIRGGTLLVLDEIGCRSEVTDHHYETVCEFADIRIRKPTIYLSNLKPTDLGRMYDDRIVSRMICGTVLELQGKDRRLS